MSTSEELGCSDPVNRPAGDTPVETSLTPSAPLDPLIWVPNDLLPRIFVRIVNQDYDRLIRVSKAWRDYTTSPSPAWRDVTLRLRLRCESDSVPALTWLDQRASEVQKLHLTLRPWKSGRNEPQLGGSEPDGGPTLATILKKTNLKALHVKDYTSFARHAQYAGSGILGTLQEKTTLECLSIRNLQDLRVKSDLELIPSFVWLKELFLYMCCYTSTQQVLSKSLSALTELRKLGLSRGCLKYHGHLDGQLDGVSGLTKLEALDLPVPDTRDLHLARLTRLTTLVLQFEGIPPNWDLTPDLELPVSLLELRVASHKLPTNLSACTALRHLELDTRFIYHDERSHKNLARVIEKLTCLECLMIHGCRYYVPLLNALAGLPNLRVLNLIGGVKLHSTAHWAVLAQLHTLNLSGMTTRGFVRILPMAVDLEVLHVAKEMLSEAFCLEEAESIPFVKVLGRLPKLRKLKIISFLNELPPAVEKAFQEAAPQLELSLQSSWPGGAAGHLLEPLSVEPSKCYQLE